MAVLKPPKSNNDNFVSHEWRCLYCGNINRLVDRSCNGCGAQRAFILDETPEEMNEQTFSQLKSKFTFASGTHKTVQVIMSENQNQEFIHAWRLDEKDE